MAYDEGLAERIREILEGRSRITEKKMFGGVAFLLGGKMFCGLAKNQLMLRVGPDAYDEALAKPHVRPMDFTGRPLRGYVYVAPAGYKTERALREWVERATAFVATLSATVKRPRATKPTKPKRR